MDKNKIEFMDYIGGLEVKKIDENNFSFFSIIKDIHLNSGKIVHGGYLSTIADTGMGNAAHMVSNKRCVTISLEIKFISAGLVGQELIGKIRVQKKTKSLIFMQGELRSNGKTLATSEGIWKILK